MTRDHSHPFPEAARVFVVANTPAYLFKHFLSIQRIQALATEMSTKALVKRCTQLSAMKKPAMDDELEFYVHLVALCFAPKSEYRGALADLAKSPFRWAKPLISLIDSHAKATDVLILDTPELPSASLHPEHQPYSPSEVHLASDSGGLSC